MSEGGAAEAHLIGRGDGSKQAKMVLRAVTLGQGPAVLGALATRLGPSFSSCIMGKVLLLPLLGKASEMVLP